jgi:alkylhydroperoxidase family enzyme
LSLAQGDTPAPPRFPAADHDEAWKLLPREDPPLPAWARILARPLPRTTGAMLELDYAHRVKNPLGPVLAGKLRWAAADAIGCDYARRYAEADLRRAGLRDDDLKQLAGDRQDLPEDERAALTFARKLTRAAHQVTDDEVAALLKQFGPDKVVGMAHTLAYANFQNRLFLALGVAVEPGGPLPPVDLRLDPAKRAEVPTPPRPPWEELRKATTPSRTTAPPDWGGRSFADLGKALDRQKQGRPRIPLPDPGRLADLPPAAREQASKIVWTNVSMGYQPRLTAAWFDCMRTFQQESKLDRVFANSVFWVITRSNECFY